MNRTQLRIALWIVLGLAQVSVPVWMIQREEHTLSLGTTLRFRLAPYDPADPFRGRYMNLRFEAEDKDYSAPAQLDLSGKQELHAVLDVDAEGFAIIRELSLQKPQGPYLRLPRENWHESGPGAKRVSVTLPFKRFYLNENKAHAVETKANDLLREARKRKEPSPVFAVVRLHEGKAVLTGLEGPEGVLK